MDDGMSCNFVTLMDLEFAQSGRINGVYLCFDRFEPPMPLKTVRATTGIQIFNGHLES